MATNHEVSLPRMVTGRELLAAVSTVCIEGRYHSTGRDPHKLFAGQYDPDASKSLLISAAPKLCEESGIDPDRSYDRVWLVGYVWSLPYDPFDGRYLSNEPAERLAARIQAVFA